MCDTLVSITDEGVLCAKNSDRDPNEAQVPRWVPAADHPAGSRLRCTWIDIPQAPHTNAVLISQPWWMWGAEMGTNEHGLTIGNEAVFTHEPKGDAALLGMDLVRLGLERATGADAAVEVIVTLLERHGQGGSASHEHPGFTYHNSFLIADPDGAIVLETAGRHWATEHVSGPGRSISNGLTIPGFAEVHRDRLREKVAACAARRAITEPRAAAATGPGDLIATLADHGTGDGPTWKISNGALGAPCAHAGGVLTATQTTASWIADLRHRPRVWLSATSAPCTSLFMPTWLDGDFPDLGPASNRFDRKVRWWRHEVLHRLVLRDHTASMARIGGRLRAIQNGWLDDPPSITDALAQADEFDSIAAAELAAAMGPDRRPVWLRQLWRRWDRTADMVESSSLPGS